MSISFLEDHGKFCMVANLSYGGDSIGYYVCSRKIFYSDRKLRLADIFSSPGVYEGVLLPVRGDQRKNKAKRTGSCLLVQGSAGLALVTEAEVVFHTNPEKHSGPLPCSRKRPLHVREKRQDSL